MFACPAGVYFPSEDSYFLAESVKIRKGCSVADVGCGSGIQSLNALMKGAAKIVALDINGEAAKITVRNCEKAGFSGKIVARKSDLFEKFRGKADCIIFNPPYVESEGIDYADLDGGRKGREVLDKFLGQMPERLDKDGVCFFLQTDLNGHAETERKLRGAGMGFRIIAKKRGFFEELAVYECRKKEHGHYRNFRLKKTR